MKPADELGERWRKELDQWAQGRTDLARATHKFSRTIKQPPRARTSVWLIRFVLGGTVASVVAGLWLLLRPIGNTNLGTPALSYVSKDQSVRFSDGSELSLQSEARINIEKVSPYGAHVALQKGTVEVSVRHRDNTLWSVSAGTFLVRVTGTKFRLQWQPGSQDLRLDMHEGEVIVTGGCLRGPRRLNTGQGLALRCNEGGPTTRTSKDPDVPRQPPEQARARATGRAPKPPAPVVTVSSPPRSPRVAAARGHTVPSPEPMAQRLSAEVQLLAAMRKSLAAEPELTLRFANEAREEFANGALMEEREALAVLALARLGRRDELRVRGQAFLARFPQSGFAARVRATLNDESP